MSRIIVKNLPKKIEKKTLEDIFKAKGQVTDVQLKFTKEGKFRQFAFIGYETEKEALDAIKHFDKTFVSTSRVTVEKCADLNKKEEEKAPQKTEGTSSVGKKKVDKLRQMIEEHKNDPEFQEFMEVHKKSGGVWENDVNLVTEEAAEAPIQAINVEEKEEEEEKLADKEISDKDYLKSLKKAAAPVAPKKPKKRKDEGFKVKLLDLPQKRNHRDIEKFFEPLKVKAINIPSPKEPYAYVWFKSQSDLTKALEKHKSFLNGRQIKVFDWTKRGKLTAEQKERENAKWKNQNESAKGVEEIWETGKLFFRNLTYTITEDDLEKHFSKIGPITDIRLKIDPMTGKNTGVGTVTFMMPEHAVKAFMELNATQFHGRLFHLTPYDAEKTNEKPDSKDGEISSTNYKALKNQKLKEKANSSYTWNSLFIGANAVTEAMAKTYNVTKEQVLDTAKGGSSAAVRLALGEAQIVNDMKKFLEENGVCLKSFDGIPQKRSKTIFLVKNLPAGTDVKEIREMYSKFGELGRVLLPLSGVTCIVEFLQPLNAKNAFKGTAFKNFHGQMLYLEWAPEKTFSTEASTEKSITEEKPEKVPQEAPKVEEEKETIDDDNEPPEENTTLFIKNLNFITREETVRKHFEKLGPIHSVQVAMKKGPQGERQALGYGFIQFKKRATVMKALKTLQFSIIEGNKIELKQSDRTLSNEVSARKTTKSSQKQTGTKICVRNIPFPAKATEINDIFKVFGELKDVRLPKKQNADGHRGFGFVDFFTKEDAKRAFDALSGSVHLLGRRLVLEWAEEDNIEDLRKRTAAHFDDKRPQSKKAKAVFTIDEKMDADDDNDDE